MVNYVDDRALNIEWRVGIGAYQTLAPGSSFAWYSWMPYLLVSATFHSLNGGALHMNLDHGVVRQTSRQGRLVTSHISTAALDARFSNCNRILVSVNFFLGADSDTNGGSVHRRSSRAIPRSLGKQHRR